MANDIPVFLDLVLTQSIKIPFPCGINRCCDPIIDIHKLNKSYNLVIWISLSEFFKDN